MYAEAFARDRSLAENLALAHRHLAVRSAILADAAPSRMRALEWLRADLRLRAEQVGGRSFPKAWPAAKALRGWLKNPAFAAVRDRIDALPEAEREAWRKFWADVVTLLKRAETK